MLGRCERRLAVVAGCWWRWCRYLDDGDELERRDVVRRVLTGARGTPRPGTWHSRRRSLCRLRVLNWLHLQSISTDQLSYVYVYMQVRISQDFNLWGLKIRERGQAIRALKAAPTWKAESRVERDRFPNHHQLGRLRWMLPRRVQGAVRGAAPAAKRFLHFIDARWLFPGIYKVLIMLQRASTLACCIT